LSDERPAAVIVLAAGAGTRMKSAVPKVLHRIAGRTLLHHVLAAAADAEPGRIVVVVRHEAELVSAHVREVAPTALIADQDEIPGTGRAVWGALTALDAAAGAALDGARSRSANEVAAAKVTGTLLVTSGDVPLMDGGTLSALAASHRADGSAVTVLTTIVADPTGYGRIIRDPETGDVARIVEEGDATEDEREITEINTGTYAFDAGALRSALAGIGRENAQGEIYLTDAIAAARALGGAVRAIMIEDSAAAEGVNDRVQLARAGAELNARILERWMLDGVTIIDPATTWIDAGVTLAADVTLLPGTHLHGTTAVATLATIGPDTTLTDVIVGEGATIVRSHGTGSVIGAGASVGPFSYLRPGTNLGRDGKIGAFVETKNAQIGRGSKVPHLSYVGDATVGEESNIGAATIFVNYDGVTKHHTTVGSHVRIGSDNTLIAPVTIGDGAYTGAGAIIRHDVPAGALGMNSAPQQTVEGWVERRRPGTPSAKAAEAARDAATKPEALAPGAQKERAAARRSKAKGES
jgi:bifunctional UDP-N-acetylglucosamine pyrophosphorylase/glucosamine-1-phosphate N-acetyltransferase